jgi:hypothetical protein
VVAINQKRSGGSPKLTATSLSTQSLRLICPRLAFMTANNDPLSVGFPLIRFRRQNSEGRPFGFRQHAKLAFSVQPLSQV